MTWLSVIFILEPEAAMYSVYMGIIVTLVMIINVVSYTRNSIMEKMAFTLLDKTRIEMKLSDREEDDKEEGDNG
ncbi:MAG: hypothetical protein IKU64_06135 [Bacteroides sp.]|nr:hypothetical protein [Bacteroides sp.]